MSASHNFPSRLASVGLQFVLGYCLFAAQTKFLFALAQDTVSDILIRGGTVVTSQREFLSDVLIYKGKIVKLGRNIDSSKAKRVIDAEGKYILPGGIDPHTHLEMSFMGAIACDDFSSGHKAALAGGTTMHIDFVVPMEGSLLKGYEAYRKKARIAHMDYGFHLVINTYNEQIEKEMEILVKEKGINSFKFFLAYKGALMISDEHFLQGMLKAKELGAIVQVHAENGDAVAYGQQYIFEDLKIHGPEENVRVVGEATLAGLTLDESKNGFII
ncbi:putative Dihydropyrimidinase, partial [Cardiosporidium cionae]